MTKNIPEFKVVSTRTKKVLNTKQDKNAFTYQTVEIK